MQHAEVLCLFDRCELYQLQVSEPDKISVQRRDKLSKALHI